MFNNHLFYDQFLSKKLKKEGEEDDDGKTIVEDEMQEIDEPLHDPRDPVYQKHERAKKALGLVGKDIKLKHSKYKETNTKPIQTDKVSKVKNNYV